MNNVDKGHLFPCVVSMMGHFASLAYYAQTPTGSAAFTTAEAATTFAEAWKERRRYRDELPESVVYEVSGCLAYEYDDGTTDVSAGHAIEEADFFGIYTRDAEGLAVWLADANTIEEAVFVTEALRKIPV